MKIKVKNISEKINKIVSAWDGVRAVLLQDFVGEDIYDPFFTLMLDVFHDAPLLHPKKRQEKLTDAQYFTTLRRKTEDRFVIAELPVRLSYHNIKRVKLALEAIGSESWLAEEESTHLFHRITKGRILWEEGHWIKTLRKKLSSLPNSFWSAWLESSQSRTDFALSDLRVAVLKNDPLFFQFSLSGFLTSISETLFALNHTFEPAPREQGKALTQLKTLPQGFQARWESLLREDSELTAERKEEIAELLARSIFSINPLG